MIAPVTCSQPARLLVIDELSQKDRAVTLVVAGAQPIDPESVGEKTSTWDDEACSARGCKRVVGRHSEGIRGDP